MTHLYSSSYYNNPEFLIENEHWIYDNCNEEVDEKNLSKNILGNNINLEGGGCFRYYYNNNKKYYSINDKINFKFPYLYQYNSERNCNLFLCSIAERCYINSLLSNILRQCGTEEETNEYLNDNIEINLRILEQYIDIKNYNESIYHFIESIASLINNVDIKLNNINLIPLDIELKSGILFPSSKIINTYIIEQNAVIPLNINKNITKTSSIFDFYLKIQDKYLK